MAVLRVDLTYPYIFPMESKKISGVFCNRMISRQLTRKEA